VARFVRDEALRAVNPLNFGGLISQAIAFITGGISAYRTWDFYRNKSESNQQVT
jgi:hypothetical protein